MCTQVWHVILLMNRYTTEQLGLGVITIIVRLHSSVTRFFSARNYRTIAKKYRFFTKIMVYWIFDAILNKFYQINMTKKMVCPVQIIVLKKLRSFFTFSSRKLSCNYRIIVHLATLLHSHGELCYQFIYFSLNSLIFDGLHLREEDGLLKHNSHRTASKK